MCDNCGSYITIFYTVSNGRFITHTRGLLFQGDSMHTTVYNLPCPLPPSLSLFLLIPWSSIFSFLFFSFRLCLILLGLHNLNNTYQKTIVIIKVIKRYITHHPGGGVCDRRRKEERNYVRIHGVCSFLHTHTLSLSLFIFMYDWPLWIQNPIS